MRSLELQVARNGALDWGSQTKVHMSPLPLLAQASFASLGPLSS